MIEFILDLGGIVDGMGDFLAAELGEAPTQPHHRDPHRARAHAESLGEFGVGLAVFVTQNVALEFREQVAVPGRRGFGFQPSQGGVNQGQRPPAFEQLFGRPTFDRVTLVTLTGGQRIQGEGAKISASLLAMLMVVDVDQVMPEGDPEKRAQPGLRGFELLEGLARYGSPKLKPPV